MKEVAWCGGRSMVWRIEVEGQGCEMQWTECAIFDRDMISKLQYSKWSLYPQDFPSNPLQCAVVEEWWATDVAISDREIFRENQAGPGTCYFYFQ